MRKLTGSVFRALFFWPGGAGALGPVPRGCGHGPSFQRVCVALSVQ